MNSADVIWKLVQMLIEEIQKSKANDQSKKDQYITNQKEIVRWAYYLFSVTYEHADVYYVYNYISILTLKNTNVNYLKRNN